MTEKEEGDGERVTFGLIKNYAIPFNTLGQWRTMERSDGRRLT